MSYTLVEPAGRNGYAVLMEIEDEDGWERSVLELWFLVCGEHVRSQTS